MKTKSLISVVIPTYNRKEYLKEALRSVENQTYDNIEVIVIDDSPKKIPKSFFSQFKIDIKYIYNDIRKGLQESRNLGIAESNGEYIAFLDDDDKWNSYKLEKQIEYFDDSTDLVSCLTSDMNPTKHNPTFNDLIKKYTLGTTSTFLVKKKVIIDVGGWDTDCIASEDHALGLKISKYYNVKIFPEILVERAAPTNHLGINYLGKIQGHLYIYSKFGKYYDFDDNIKFLLWLFLLTICHIFKCKNEDIINKIQKIF